MKCTICGDDYVLLNKSGGKPKKRTTCRKTSCNNKWTWEAKKEEYKKKKLEAYYKYKATKPGYVEAINKKAKANQRYGVKNRELLIKEKGSACENCGAKKKLIIHHIDNKGRRAEKDGEEENNHPSNLMVLCHSCHSKHHLHGDEVKRRYSPLFQETES
jgi:HNH endonuclease